MNARFALWACLYLGLILGSSTASAVPAPPDPSPRIQDADEHLRQAAAIYGQLLDSGLLPADKRTLLKSLLESQPPETVNLYYLGLLHRAEGRWSEALAYFQRAARAMPEFGENRFAQKGVRFEQEGRENEAILEYSTALKLNPQLDSLRLRLAQLLIGERDFEAAERHLQPLLDHKSLRAQALTLSGQIALEKGQLDRAVQALESALREDSGISPARLLLARAYRSQGLHEKALEQYDQVLPLFPSDEALRKEASETKGLVGRIREEREKLHYPNALVDVGGSAPYALLVEKSTQRVYLYKQNLGGNMERIATYDTTTGKTSGDKISRGDQRTPEGVYFLTARIPRQRLEPRFGAMAFPMNYPNEIDQWLGKSGGGIWLHGVDPKDESRPPFNSRGCVVVKNETLNALSNFITVNLTPIAVVEKATYAGRDKTLKDRELLRRTLQGWSQSWEKSDLPSYIRYYSDRFRGQGRNKAAWKDYKSRVFASKEGVSIRLEELKLLRYDRTTPFGEEVVVAQYIQHYRSKGLNDTGLKRLYLVREGSDYKILTETWLPFRPVEPFPLVGAGLVEPE
ncbi:MAG: tetratricopeptide repeat protein [Nitrospirae bacterium]|nr:tetratricopeptide repeat protein [Nitrospirota bacterium]